MTGFITISAGQVQTVQLPRHPKLPRYPALRHQRPGIYLRQVDPPGVDHKFIEVHRAVLAELLDLTLPSD